MADARAKQRRVTVKVSAIRALARLHCTTREAAAALRVSHKTFLEFIRIDQSARDAWEDGQQLGKKRIREVQFALAERNAQMAIWLGRQILGQSDVQIIEHSGRDGGPIKMLDLSKLSSAQRRDLREALVTARVTKKGSGGSSDH